MASVMDTNECAAFLKVHPSTIYRMLKHREIPAFKVGSDWRFIRESIERWCLEREATSEVTTGRRSTIGIAPSIAPEASDKERAQFFKGLKPNELKDLKSLPIATRGRMS